MSGRGLGCGRGVQHGWRLQPSNPAPIEAWPLLCGHGLMHGGLDFQHGAGPQAWGVASVVGRELWCQAWPRTLTICRTSEETICMQHMAVASAHTMVETTLRAHTLKRRSWEQRGEVSVWPSGQQSPPQWRGGASDTEMRRGTQGSCCRQTGP